MCAFRHDRNQLRWALRVVHYPYHKSFRGKQDLRGIEYIWHNLEKCTTLQFGCFQFNAEQMSGENDMNVIFLRLNCVSN